MRRWITLAAVTAALTLGITVGTPPGVAQALCNSSISPECQPQNLPILIEAGMASAGAKTISTAIGVAATNAAAAPAGAMANLTFNAAAAGLGMAVITTAVGGTEAIGALFADGMHGQVIKTDPNYISPSNPSCKGYNSVQFAITAGGDCGETAEITGTDPDLGAYASRATNVQVTYRAGAATLSWVANSNNWRGDMYAILVCETTGGSQHLTQGIGTTFWVEPKGRAVPSSMNLSCSGGLQEPVGVIYTFQYIGTGFPSTNVGDWFPLTRNYVPTPGGGDGLQKGVFTVYLECMNTTGVVRTQLYAQRAEWSPGDDIPLDSVLCSPGETSVGLRLTWTPDGGEAIEIIPTGQVADSLKNLPLEYPDCFGPGDSCSVELYKIGSGGVRESCGPNATFCPDWAKTPAETMPSAYECKFGAAVIAIDYCSMYRAPDVGVLPNSRATPGGGTEILSPSAPVPDPLPNPLKGSDGAPVPTLPPVLAQPDTGQGSSDCWPSGWGVFNPLAWVYMPVSCALKAQFTPRQIYVDRALGTIQSMWASTTPGKYLDTIGGIQFEGASGCSGMSIDMSWIPFANVGTYQFLPACPGDFFGNIAPLFKVFLFGTLAVGGFFGITRQIGSLVNSRGVGGSDD
jgi:hypothetical protein